MQIAHHFQTLEKEWKKGSIGTADFAKIAGITKITNGASVSRNRFSHGHHLYRSPTRLRGRARNRKIDREDNNEARGH
jgi:hypothetical protein